MNKKGYTLIELLATLTILAIVMTVVFPAVNKVLIKNDSVIIESAGKSVIVAAKKYVNNEKFNGKGCKRIPVSDLVNKDLLNINMGQKLTLDYANSYAIVSLSDNGKNQVYNYHLVVSKDGETKEYDSDKLATTGCLDDYSGSSITRVLPTKGFPTPKYNLNDCDNGIGYFPVKYNSQNDNWVVADDNTSRNNKYRWYDYDNGQWANIAAVNSCATSSDIVGSIVPNIINMWVWIPRFFYRIDNGNVKVIFKDVSDDNTVPEGYILPTAFKKDNKDIRGFWFSKHNIKANSTGRIASTMYDSYDIVKTWTNSYFWEESISSYPTSDIMKNATNYGVVEAYLKVEKDYKDTDTREFHFMKSSEFSAVLLLAASEYGLNTNLNNLSFSSWQTGTAYSSGRYSKNSGNSSTQNPSGVFDMSSGYLYTDIYVGRLYNDFLYESTSKNKDLLNNKFLFDFKDEIYSGNSEENELNYDSLAANFMDYTQNSRNDFIEEDTLFGCLNGDSTCELNDDTLNEQVDKYNVICDNNENNRLCNFVNSGEYDLIEGLWVWDLTGSKPKVKILTYKFINEVTDDYKNKLKEGVKYCDFLTKDEYYKKFDYKGKSVFRVTMVDK